MHFTTSSHKLSLNDDGIYELRRIVGDDAWLHTRKGEAFGRKLAVHRLSTKPSVEVFFENTNCGEIPLADQQNISDMAKFIRYWNNHVAPTDLITAKIAELLEAPDIRKPFLVTTRYTTWNAAGNLGGCDPGVWHGLASTEDILVYGFQESDRLDRNISANAVTLSTAIKELQLVLPEHELLMSNQLLGLMTLIFIKKPLRKHVSQISTSTSGTGFLKMWGNKGAILARFKLFWDDVLGDGIDFSVVNCHLSAGEARSQLGRRKWELSEIGKRFSIKDLSPQTTEKYDVSPTSSISEDSDIDEDLGEKVFNEDSDDDDATLTSTSSTTKPVGTVGTTGSVGTVGTGGAVGAFVKSTLMGNGRTSPPPAKNIQMDFDEQDTKGGQTSDDDSLGVATPDPLSSDCQSDGSPLVVLLGDLNYRVQSTDSQVKELIKLQDFQSVLRRDSLTLERKNKCVLVDFVEEPINFPPTYKFQIGSNKYANRIPSYTDRILYRTALPVSVDSYQALSSVSASDHKPVALTCNVRAMKIDSDSRAAAVSRALRLVDAAENRVRPRVSVTPAEITFSGPPLSLQIADLTLKSQNHRPIEWTSESTEPLLELHPQKGRVKSSEEVVKLQVQLRIPPGRPKTHLLSIKPKDGTDTFIAVAVEPSASVLGSAHPDPKIIQRCIDYLTANVTAKLLGEPQLGLACDVLIWLDNNRPFDGEVLAAANAIEPGTSERTVFYVLMKILKHTAQRMLSPNRQEELSTTAREFLKFVQLAIDSGVPEQEMFHALTGVVYDGPEPEAYLKSALIMVSAAGETPDPDPIAPIAPIAPPAGQDT